MRMRAFFFLQKRREIRISSSWQTIILEDGGFTKQFQTGLLYRRSVAGLKLKGLFGKLLSATSGMLTAGLKGSEGREIRAT
jgi:hypothetical protein